jgi:hypothetical protein
MRITDPGEEEASTFNRPSNILQSIKAQSKFSTPGQPVENEEIDTPKITADIQSAKLKQLLGSIKTGG